jgi:septal ring factor EnvC (AmiA/AmiB activator)
MPPIRSSAMAIPGCRVARLAAAALGAAAVLALAAPGAGGQSISDLQAKISSAQGQAESLSADVAAKSDELVAARSQATAAAAREMQLTTVLARGEQREALLNTRVGEAQARLREARARLRRALDALADRLVAIYKSDDPSATELLLSSDGYDDLTTRAELLERIHAADQSLAERVRALRAQVARQLGAVEAARDQQVAYNQQVASARDQIASVRATAEARAADLEQARAEQAAAVESLRSQVAGWTQEVEDLQAAQQQAVSQEAAAQEVASWTGDYAIPSGIVQCESGGNWNAVNPSSGAGGAYQILPSTWSLYGGNGLPQNASPAEQSRIAAQIWADSGSAAWECAG